jgi:hypothetical protein
MKKYLMAGLLFFGILAIASVAAAQDSPRTKEGVSVEGRSGDTQVDIQVGKDLDQRNPQGTEKEAEAQGPEGPAGAPGPQGPPGPSGGFLGMDSTVAFLIGLAVLAIVIVAIVAASRGGSREA